MTIYIPIPFSSEMPSHTNHPRPLPRCPRPPNYSFSKLQIPSIFLIKTPESPYRDLIPRAHGNRRKKSPSKAVIHLDGLGKITPRNSSTSPSVSDVSIITEKVGVEIVLRNDRTVHDFGGRGAIAYINFARFRQHTRKGWEEKICVVFTCCRSCSHQRGEA